MKHFKIRCSQIGKIMTNPRSKSEVLSKTAQSYVEAVRIEEMYGRRYEFKSKYTDKGMLMEEEAIQYASKVLGWGDVSKNKESFEDDYMTGTPDIILPEVIPDIKCSWSCFTFPLFDPLNKDYWWQLQGYMSLTHRERALLVHCLMDMPEELLQKEIYYKMPDTYNPDLEQEIIAYHTYSNLPDKLRIKTFEIERDQSAIDSIHVRVEECRQYYLELVKLIK